MHCDSFPDTRLQWQFYWSNNNVFNMMQYCLTFSCLDVPIDSVAQLGHWNNYMDRFLFWCHEQVLCRSSGVTRVGVARGGNWGCHPYFFPEKNCWPFLYSHHRLPVLRCRSCLFSPEKLMTFFAHHCHFYWFHSGVTPWRVSPAPFLPVRPRLSTILCKFSNRFFFVRVSPPGGCHPGRSALSP